jgi:hypothetical protein
MSAEIITYDDRKSMEIPLSSRNTPIKELLQLTRKSLDIYKYLALNDTKRIVDVNKTVLSLNKTKFILVKKR